MAGLPAVLKRTYCGRTTAFDQRRLHSETTLVLRRSGGWGEREKDQEVQRSPRRFSFALGQDHHGRLLDFWQLQRVVN